MPLLYLLIKAALSGLIAAHSEATFWFVLPSLPMFLVLPVLLRHGINFWPSMVLACLLTIGLYFLTMWLLPKWGINL
jgi:hypothetical protein